MCVDHDGSHVRLLDVILASGVGCIFTERNDNVATQACCQRSCYLQRAAMVEANINIEALAAPIAAQHKKIQRMRCDTAPLQCEVASDSAAFQDDREMRPKESVSILERPYGSS